MPSEAILKGLAEDGGLFIPEKIPKVNLVKLKDKGYVELAKEILSEYLTDFDSETITEIVKKAYGTEFSHKNIVSLEKVDSINFLELYHGPTLAFKDMALSILPYLMIHAKKINNVKDDIVILTATSGDTGKAALNGFKDVEGIKIIVFYPNNGVSEIQKLQMITQKGNNTFVVAINGNFDDAQKAVKKAFLNNELIKLLKDNNYVFSSANSINIGRLIPQIVYYFYGYFQMVKNKDIKMNEEINIVVPTGNFGNILAAYYAKEMGLPVGKLICASNENNILTDFINTGIYDTKRDFVKTISPSMDILISSNLERFIFEVLGRDAGYVEKLMRDLKEKGKFDIGKENHEKVKKIMWGNYCSEGETYSGIKECYINNNYLLDPHTAVAYNVALKYKNKTNDNKQILLASTASPYKFSLAILKAITDLEGNIGVSESNKEISKLFGRKIPDSLVNIENEKIIHNRECDVKHIEDIIIDILRVIK